MAKKKKNKKEQTFNVYPYLGGYQHFMRNGGALPKFENTGAVDPSVIANRIKPTNKYKYANTWEGVVDEWRANNDPNYVPRGSFMGQLAGGIGAAVDFGRSVGDVFDKDNYKPGGKWSKYQTTKIPGKLASCTKPEYTTEEACTNNGGVWNPGTDTQEVFGGLKYGRTSFTNTTDENALLHTDNLAKYLDMSKKEKKEFIESGGRNTDLWWSTDDMQHGKWNWMDLNEDGTPKYDGLNLRASILRGDALEEQTGDRMFSNKTRVKQPDGSYKFVYFDENRNMIMNPDLVRTKYDEIEEGTGTGQLGDADATHMNISYGVDGSAEPIGIDDQGNPIYPPTNPADNQLTSFDHYVTGEDGKRKKVDNVVYDENKEYGNYVQNKNFQVNEQLKNDCETGNHCPGGARGVFVGDESGGHCECNTGAMYGKEIPEYLKGGGTASEGAVLCDAYDQPIDPEKAWAADVNNNYKGPGMNNDSDKIRRGLFKYGGGLDAFVYGGALPKYQEGSTTPGQTVCPPPEGGCPEGQTWDKKACTCQSAEIDLGNNQSPYVYNDPNNPPIENPNANAEEPIMCAPGDATCNQPDVPVISKEALDAEVYAENNMQNPNVPRQQVTATCSDGTSTTKEECEANGGTWTDPQDMGIDTNYGDGPLQKGWNWGREKLNTGVFGAIKDTVVGQSAEQYCSDPKYKTKEECEKAGEQWTDQKGTGLVSLAFDHLMPMAHNIMSQNQERKNELHKRSVSAEDMFAATESGVGAGQRGFYDINKGGYGDDLYGTGKIFGQIAQQGVELPPQNQKDFSVASSYMNLEDGLKFDLELLRQQKGYLGKMNTGGQPDIAKAMQAKANPMGAVVTALQDGTAQNSMNAWFSGDMEGWANAGPMKFGGGLPKFQELGGVKGHYSEEDMENVPFSVDDLGNVINTQNISNVSTSFDTHIVDSEKDINKFTSDWESMSSFANSPGSNPYMTRKSWWDRNILGGKKHEGEEGYVIGNWGNYYNPNRKRDVRLLEKNARKAGFDNVDDYLASINYTMGEDGIPISDAYISKRYSRTKDGQHSSTYGTFHLPKEGESEGQFTFRTADGRLLKGESARIAYEQAYGQHTRDESGIYSNPKSGIILPEVVVKGAYGGQLPKANDGTESKPWYSKFADYTQTALSGAGLTPGPVGFVADAINTGISGTRTAYNAAIGDTESAKIHGENLALNAASMVPGPTGWAAGGTAIAKDMANYAGVTDADKSIGTQVADVVKDQKTNLITENMGESGTKKIGNKAKYGKETANIDMDLYYELLRAGADIKIIR